MTRTIMQLSLLFLCAFASVSHGAAPGGETLAQQKHALKAKKAWVLESGDGFIVTDVHKGERKKTITASTLTITSANNTILVNAADTKTAHIRITPVKGLLVYNGCLYDGSMTVSIDGDVISLMHHGIADQGNASAQSRARVKKKRGMHIVRVLLDEKAINTGHLWQLRAQGFTVATSPTPADGERYATKKMHIHVADGALYLNDKKQTNNTLFFFPQKGFVTWDDKRYHGYFMITKRNGSWLLINILPLEDYVYCVLKSESWPGWPLEINKVLAIASRSYVLAKMVRADAAHLPYHILNTNMHQVYAGIHDSPVLKQAVEQTKGIFLSYNNAPIIAMFDSCCGGVIPADIKGINFKEAPYLKRTEACHFCSSCSTYNWRVECDGPTIADALSAEYPRLRTIRTIRVTQKDRAGLVQQVTIKGRHGHVTIPGHTLRALFPKLKSLCFSIYRSGDTYTIKGHGQGHNRGLCQWGAREMVRQGYEYEEILAFYYPKTVLTKLA